MLLDIFLSVTSLTTTVVTKSTSPAILQYLMLLAMGGAAALSKKQLNKATRKMKWQLLKQTVKSLFNKGDKNSKGKIILRVILILLLGGLITWALVTWLGNLGWLVVLLTLIILFKSVKTSHFR